MIGSSLARWNRATATRPTFLRFFSVNRAAERDELEDLEHYRKILVDTVRLQSFHYAQLDPLGLTKLEKKNPELEEATERLLSFQEGAANLQSLRSIYQGHIGYEFDRLPADERAWLTAQIEAMHSTQASPARQRHIARLLGESEAWDLFMGKRFGQVKRYGLEGAESMLVAMDTLFQLAVSGFKGKEGQDDTGRHAVIAMAHRGRLNLMVGLLGFPVEAIFHKLQGNSELPGEGTADVLSHLSLEREIRKGLRATLLPNSSHLESVNPIAQGYAYGLLERQKVKTKNDLLPIQIHGDAACNGQGVTLETLQMANLEGFSVGGTIHLTVNNQLGFTTPSHLGRSCTWATDLAHLLRAPIFHVNADKPEDVARSAALAFAYRQAWGNDVFIDLVGYRRHGHNELDEPAFTQPAMYRAVKATPSVAQSYSTHLSQLGVIDASDLGKWEEAAWARFDEALQKAPAYKPKSSGLQESNKQKNIPAPTSQLLNAVAMASVAIPVGFSVHQRVAKFHVEARKNMLGEGQVDWATAEAMAFGSLLQSGISVRLCGQDVGRGTFSHRHLQFHDQETSEVLTPLSSLAKDGATLDIVNSHLSEFAVAGFEYGLSLQNPSGLLPVWEAQFGDFFNGAQIIWDAYLSSGKQKWGLESGMVVLLPHGYDGAGPEHSSARIERWLQMCDEPVNLAAINTQQEINMSVVNPTTAANYFHLLRRQTLLRLPGASSPISQLVKGEFQPIIDDPAIEDPAKVKKVILVSGKFYYDLAKELSGKTSNTAIVRVEELCPFPSAGLKAIQSRYKNASQWIWCQEEPENMGAYSWILPRLTQIIKASPIGYAGRPAAAAPAVGYSKLHKQQIQAIFEVLKK